MHIKINVFYLGNMYTSQPSSFKHEVKNKSKYKRKEVYTGRPHQQPTQTQDLMLPMWSLTSTTFQLWQEKLSTFCFKPKKMLKELMKGKLGQKDDQVIFIK